MTSVDVVALAVAAITQQGFPSIVGISCVQSCSADVGDKLALANVYVTSSGKTDGSSALRLYNNIVALFNPSCPSPPPENTHSLPSQIYNLFPSSVSIQISPFDIPLVGGADCLNVRFLDDANCSASLAKLVALATCLPNDLSDNTLDSIYTWVA